jgi:hypothetical protein
LFITARSTTSLPVAFDQRILFLRSLGQQAASLGHRQRKGEDDQKGRGSADNVHGMLLGTMWEIGSLSNPGKIPDPRLAL